MKKDSRRVSVILMLLCYFVLTIEVMHGGIVSLNSYVILVDGIPKTLILVGLVHEGDLKADTCKLDLGLFTPAKNLPHDHPAHAKIMEKVLFDRLLTDNKSLSTKGDRGKSIIPVILEADKMVKNPDANFFEQQLVTNRKTCTDPLAERSPLLCSDPRSPEDLFFMQWLNGSLPDAVQIVRDPREFGITDVQKYEEYLAQHFNFKIHPLPRGGVALYNFAPYIHVKDNLDRYEEIVSDFKSYVKRFGREDLLIPELSVRRTSTNCESAIQSNILNVNNSLLRPLKNWLAVGSLTELCKNDKRLMMSLKNSLATVMTVHLANISFFSSFAKQLLQPKVEIVVACIGNGHVEEINKFIQELGGKLSLPILGDIECREGSCRFLTPFQLRMFLSINLGLTVNKEDTTIFEEMNSGKLIDGPRCNWCRKKQSQGLLACSRCKKVLYCGSECQKADWSNHKKQCSPNPK